MKPKRLIKAVDRTVLDISGSGFSARDLIANRATKAKRLEVEQSKSGKLVKKKRPEPEVPTRKGELVKKRRPEVEVEQTKSKNELTRLPKSEEPRRKRAKSKTNLAVLESLLGESSPELQDMLDNEDDRAVPLLQKRLLQMLIDVLPMAEHNIRKTEGSKGVYQLKTMVDSIRELMLDVQANKDRSALGLQLIETVVRPGFMDMTQGVLQELATLQSQMKAHLDQEQSKALSRLQEPLLKAVAVVMQQAYQGMCRSIKEMIR